MFDRHWLQQYLKVDSYENEVSRGNVRTAYPISSYGRLIAGSGVTSTLIRDQDGTALNVPQSVQMSVVSTSADDAAAGTGARTLVIEYLNGTLDLSVEMITLNGLTPVNTVATDVRWVQAVHVATAGSGGKAAGNIDIKHNSTVYKRISAGQRNSHSSFKRVPRGKKLYISTMFAGSVSGSAATSTLVELVSTEIDGLNQQETGLFYSQAGIAIQDNSISLSPRMPQPVGEGHIVGFVATCDKGATITAGFTGWVE
jgi:hypothetical protein